MVVAGSAIAAHAFAGLASDLASDSAFGLASDWASGIADAAAVGPVRTGSAGIPFVGRTGPSRSSVRTCPADILASASGASSRRSGEVAAAAAVACDASTAAAFGCSPFGRTSASRIGRRAAAAAAGSRLDRCFGEPSAGGSGRRYLDSACSRDR